MKKPFTTSLLSFLRNQIDITRVPFSDRGSRILVYQHLGQSRLYIKLAERLVGLQPGLESYLLRPPFINDLALINEKSEVLDFDLTTTPDRLYFRTSIGEFGLVFQDKRILSFGLPDNITCGLRFHVMPQFWSTNDCGGELKSIRNLSYSTNSKVVKNIIRPEDGGYTVEFIVEGDHDCAITFHISPDLDLWHQTTPFSEACATALERWEEWFSKVPEVEERYRHSYAYAWWVMCNNLISPTGNVSYEAMTPSKTSYVGLWLWDSAMHALAYRHINPELARNQIRAMIQYQLPDGMIPDAVYDEGIVSELEHPIRAEVTKPPILAWAALKLHEMAPDLDFLKEIYVPLVRWNAWWFSMNDDDVDGLAQYNHPFSSGLDNNPLWDYGMPVESPDLNTYLCVQMGSLAMIAEELGLESEGAMWRRRAGAIVHRMIKDFWDNEAGIFRAYHLNEPIPVVTPFNLYPLWTGQLPLNIQNRLIDHLRNPDEFWGNYVIPTVARNDPHYDPDSMWRGPVWANINYFFIEALKQIGEFGLACEIQEKTLNLIMSQNGIYEYYNADNGKPPAKAANIFGWTAAVFIDLAIHATEDNTKRTIKRKKA